MKGIITWSHSLFVKNWEIQTLYNKINNEIGAYRALQKKPRRIRAPLGWLWLFFLLRRIFSDRNSDFRNNKKDVFQRPNRGFQRNNGRFWKIQIPLDTSTLTEIISPLNCRQNFDWAKSSCRTRRFSPARRADERVTSTRISLNKL